MAERPELLTFDGAVLRHGDSEWRPDRDVYAVLGHPVSHSLSPVFQNAAFAACGLDADYLRLDVAPAELDALMAGAAGLGLRGGNVTVPLKELVAGRCLRLSDEARRLGAVNTFRVGPEGWDGHNTDLGGLRDVLGAAGVRPGWRGLVLGAGGSARAAVCALCDLGLDTVEVAARPGPSAERFAAWLDAAGDAAAAVTMTGWSPRDTAHTAPLAVVVCVPFGVPVDDLLPPTPPQAGALLLDIRYGGPFGDVEAAGWERRDGLGLLLAQGARSFSWLFGIEAPRDVMAAALSD